MDVVLSEYLNKSHNFTNFIFITSSLRYSIYTKQKTLCGVRASELLRYTKFVQVWLIFTNHSDRPVVLGVVNAFISLKAGIGVPRIGTVLFSDSAYDSAAYSIVVTRRNKSITVLGPKHCGML